MFLCSGIRGLNEWLAPSGSGFYFSFTDENGIERSRVFPNIGQPDQAPVMYKHHVDDINVYDRLKIDKFSGCPMALSYHTESGLHFRIYSSETVTHIAISTRHPVIFHKIGKQTPLPLPFGIPISGNHAFSNDPGLEKDAILHALDRLLLSDHSPHTASALLNLTKSTALAREYYVPVNKVWIPFLARLFNITDVQNLLLVPWDGSFASIILADVSIELAWTNLHAILEGIQPDGRIPQIRIGNAFSNRSNPPVWFLAADQLYQKSANATALIGLIPHLLANYRWFKQNRMHQPPSQLAGTFSWGVEPQEYELTMAQTRGKYGAMMESGMDDSPVFQPMKLDGHLLNYACIDLTSLMAVACENLLTWASDESLRHCFSDHDRNELKKDWMQFPKIFQTFFPEPTGIPNFYIAKDNLKTWNPTRTPCCFYPLLTPFVSPYQVKQLEELYFNNFTNPDYPDAFLPSVSYDDPSFNGDGDYWRGRIWPPMVYLTAMGFKRHKSTVYNDIKMRADKLFVTEWHRHGHIHENYSGTTGQGEPQKGIYARSCPLYSWGGLLGTLP